MPSITQKCDVLLRADLRSMIDRALKVNSIEVADQYIHQIELNISVLAESIETVAESIHTLKRKYEEYYEQAKLLDHRDIDKLILRGKDDLRSRKDDQFVDTSRELALDYYEQWQFQEEQRRQMVELHKHLQERLKIVEQIRRDLQSWLQSDDNPTLDDANVQAIYEQADQEDMRVAEIIREAKERSELRKKELIERYKERKRRLYSKDSDYK